MENKQLNSEETVIAVREYIDNGYNNPDITLTSISEKFHYSSRQLTFLFKRKYGVTICKYLFECRKKKMLELLHEDYSIQDVAGMVGYENIRTLNRVFKNEFGVSPTEYKNAMLRGE